MEESPSSIGVRPLILIQDNPATILTIANTGATLSVGQKRSKDIAGLAVELGCARILVRHEHRNHVRL
jgi:hypothetical protein